ncbi:hypothetical protein C8Q70DRAFT_380099 [Cubamyces menziesii]|nr:hypothetical protein C8Q70DRAFT_380099 [Cubamyces menziesii]
MDETYCRLAAKQVTETPQDQDTATVPSSNLSSGSAKPERDPVPHKRNSADGGGHRWSEEDSSPHRTQEQDLSRAVRPMPTLNPNNIRPRDYVDLSNRVFVYLLRQATERHPRTSAIYYSRAEGALPSHADHKPFPAGTRGFFYWTANPRLTPLGGEIRFRITNNRFPNSMALGWDLLGPDGYSPWRMSVLQMLNTPLVDYLIDEQLISRFDIERFHNTRRGRAAKPRSNSQVCVQPGHPFVFDFTNLSPGYWETIWIVGHHFINWISFGRIAREPSAPRSGMSHGINTSRRGPF